MPFSSDLLLLVICDAFYLIIAALFWCIYEGCKANRFSILSSSIIAESVACLVRVPMDSIKIQLQTQSKCRHSPLFLYRGLFITLARDIPFACIQYPLYETLLEHTNAPISGIPMNATMPSSLIMMFRCHSRCNCCLSHHTH